MTGYGDVSYNSRRNILGAISLDKKVAYHLWVIEYSQQKNNYNIKLLQKAKWHQFYSTEIGILLIFLILSAYLPFLSRKLCHGVRIQSDWRNCSHYRPLWCMLDIRYEYE